MVRGAPVDLVVNCYERTYRGVLRRGYFDGLQRQNQIDFAGRYVVINNVDDPVAARQRAEAIRDAGEIDGFVFVSERLDSALARTGLSRRNLGERPYLFDYGLVMATTGTSPFILGWDAEVEIEEPADWITPALEVLGRRPDVFSAAPRWQERAIDTLDEETIRAESPWRMTWGFSDQVWLVRRDELAAPIYRRFAPATLVRMPTWAFSFEGRVESYQRVARRFRAVHEGVTYRHNDLDAVISRLGGPTRKERVLRRCALLTSKLLRLARSQRPSLRLP